MPFIIAALALVGLLIYGAIRLYAAVALVFGALAGAGAVLVAAALVVGAVASLIRRHRAIHGVNVKGQRILALCGAWGELSVDAEGKRGSVRLEGQQARFIFADIAGADPVAANGKWTLVLHLRHQSQAEWPIPMEGQGEAKRWAKIFALSITQEL
jgi:membrane protein implicated in regulation of membrane protease activity